MRFASAPERSARVYGGYAGRSTTLPSSLLDEDDAAQEALWGAFQELESWDDEDEADGNDCFLALSAPEHAETLDFTGIVPAVRHRTDRRTPVRALAAPVIIRPELPARFPVQQQEHQHSAPIMRHVRHATVRLAELGAARPVLCLPGRGVRRGAEVARTHWHAKLPPVWLLANLVVLVITGLAVIPRILPVDAEAGCQWYYVAPGDTLADLAAAHHTTVRFLAFANDIADPDMIYVGQRICIPLTSTAHAKSPPAVPQQKQPPRYGSARGVEAFLAYALPYARRAHEATGWPVSVILAQWGLEQGWKVPGYTGFNWGNVAALPGEPTVNGIAVPGSPAAFAYASSPEDGLRYYVRVAHLSYYQHVASAAVQDGPDAAARSLGASPWDAGHYTDQGDPGSSLLSLMHSYNLYRYDTP